MYLTNTRVRRPRPLDLVAATAAATALLLTAACSTPPEPIDEATSTTEQAATARAGAAKANNCGPCEHSSESPLGGFRTCTTPRGDETETACRPTKPPPPPPPPPETKTPCKTSANGGHLLKTCCTTAPNGDIQCAVKPL